MVHGVWYKSNTLAEALTGLTLQRRDNDSVGISIVVVIQHNIHRVVVVSIGAIESRCSSLGTVNAGVRVCRVLDFHNADDALLLLGSCAGVTGLLVLILLISVEDDDGLIRVVRYVVLLYCAGDLAFFPSSSSRRPGTGHREQRDHFVPRCTLLLLICCGLLILEEELLSDDCLITFKRSHSKAVGKAGTHDWGARLAAAG